MIGAVLDVNSVKHSRLSTMNAPTTLPVLQKGSQGAAVKELQTLLNKHFGVPSIGGPIVVDGIFGQVTEARVKTAQYRYLLKMDGIVGNLTWKALKANSALTATKPTLRRGSTGSEVEVVQKLLKESGYYKSVIDQIFGQNTENAVKAFQRDRKLTVDGIVGVKTWQEYEKLATYLTFD